MGSGIGNLNLWFQNKRNLWDEYGRELSTAMPSESVIS